MTCLDTTPMHYRAELRMNLADELLDSRQSVARVAETLRVQTNAAFRGTFKRLRKVGSGTVRREARH
jgi:transcriptional regulator GlxA family with amidase domain